MKTNPKPAKTPRASAVKKVPKGRTFKMWAIGYCADDKSDWPHVLKHGPWKMLCWKPMISDIIDRRQQVMEVRATIRRQPRPARSRK